MSTDFTKPVVGDAYATLLPGIVTAINDLARGLEPTLTGTSTNVPTGAIRWNAGTSLWERYNGTSWAALAATYGISISGSAGSAATASNLTGGVAGAVPYQTGAGASAFSAAGTSGQVLSSNGTGAPTWIAQSALTAGNASAVAWSGVSGKPTTVGGYGITDGITTANIGSQSVNYATTAGTAFNIAGGSNGSIPYQSALGTTLQLAAGTAGQVLQTNGAASPSWVNSPNSIYTTATTPLNAPSVLYVVTHGLGQVPVNCVLEITCLTAENGYAVGDVVVNPPVWNGTTSSPSTVWKNATQCGLVLPSLNALYTEHKTTAAPLTATPANWSYRFRLTKN
jgi:hypothetical protein